MTKRLLGGLLATVSLFVLAGVVLAVATPIDDSSQAVAEDAVNAAITLTASTDNLSATDATATITSGPAHGGIQEVTPAAMTCASGSCSGTVHYSPNADYNGTDSFTFNVDDGSGPSSTDGTITITVTAVNDPPSFTKGANVGVNEDSGPQTVAGWATGMSPGPSDESGQTLDFQLTTDTDTTLFAVEPAVDATTGDLTFTPAPDANGSATIGFKLHDSGGGTDLSPEQTFTITIDPVNDAPSFTKGADVVVNKDTGAYTSTGWATNVSAGPPDESGQVLTFSFTANDNPTLFSAGPAVSADGTLTFTPAAGLTGTANLTLQLQDDGGTGSGGQDTSAGQDFTIRVNAPPNAVNDTSFVVPENSPGQVLDVMANDTSLPDPPETLTIVSVTQPAHGSVVISDAGADVTYTPTPLYYGDLSDFFTYTISDGYDTDSATVILSITKDTTAPKVTAVTERLRTAVTMTSTTLPGRVTWTGSDGAGVGVSHYTIQRSVNGGSYATLASPTTTTYNVSYTVGSNSYRFRVRAVDRNGNVGAWAYTPTVHDTRSQETSGYITYHGTWARTLNVNDSGGAAEYTGVANRYASFHRTMRDVALVMPTSSTRGSVKIYVDGVYKQTVSLRTSSTLYRRVVWTWHFTNTGVTSHTIKVLVVGNGRIDLDCFEVLY